MSFDARRDKLRRLAERPGTEHEGAVAREMLKRLDQKARSGFGVEETEPLAAYQSYMRREMSVDAFVEDLCKFTGHKLVKCACGAQYAGLPRCPNWTRHMEIQTEIRDTFKKGDRVLYNYHAYPPDCPGKVSGHIRLMQENGTYPWAWIMVKFDCYKSARQIPIYSSEGWHLKHDVREQREI